MELQQAKKVVGLSMLAGASIGIAVSLLDRFFNSEFKKNGGSPESPGNAKTLKEAPLSKALNPMMEEAAFLEWRKKYRKYRMGEKRGASGEASRFLKSNHGFKMTSAQHLGEECSKTRLEGITEKLNNPLRKKSSFKMESSRLDDTFAFYDDKDGSWESLNRADPANVLTVYRRAYREHRKGHTKGAKGEVTDLPQEVPSPRRRIDSESTNNCSSEATEEAQEVL